MRRPATQSIEEERKIKPFAKKPITFMFHATYGENLINIMEHGLKSGRSRSNPSERVRIHMARIDDVILDDEASEAALTHVPTGRDALLTLAFLKDQDYDIRPSEERTALTEQTVEARNIVTAFDPEGNIVMSNSWIMKKNLGREDIEMYISKIQEFADAYFKHVNNDHQNKENPKKDTLTETKKRRRSTDQDEVEEENMELSGERSVKPKVTMEYHNRENLDAFIQELKEIYLKVEMSKKDAEEELVETKRNFIRFMEKYNKDPKGADPKLTECERASLAHVDPDVNLEAEEFYFHNRGECPTMDEYRKAQPVSGYPIKLPLGLKKLKSYDNIRAFADILGSLMQPTDRSPVDHLKTHEFTSSLTINMLTMNHGNLTRNPKLDSVQHGNDWPVIKDMLFMPFLCAFFGPKTLFFRVRVLCQTICFSEVFFC